MNTEKLRWLIREPDFRVTWLLPIRKGECMYFKDFFFTKLIIIVCYKPLFLFFWRLTIFLLSELSDLIRPLIDRRFQLAIDLLSESKIQGGKIGRSTVPTMTKPAQRNSQWIEGGIS